MREIKLSKGFSAIVDDGDFEELSKFKWYYHFGYAKRNVILSTGKTGLLRMHLSIMGETNGLEVDHVNGNGIDNRRENLRLVTHSQNQCNARKQQRETSSRYKGVCLIKNSNKWSSYIMSNKKKLYLGCFISEQEAALAYNTAASSLFGQYARLNTF